jgi:hypothetical protein
MTRWLLVLCAAGLPAGLAGQTARDTGTTGDFNFILHLVSNKMFEEAEAEKVRFLSAPGVSALYADSVNFALGVNYAIEKRLSDSRRAYLQVSERTSMYYPARYRAVLHALSLEDAAGAFREVAAVEQSDNETLNELRRFELAGIALANGYRSYYDSVSPSLAFSEPLLAAEALNLQKYRVALDRNKRKSPFVAGLLSTVVPGLGKVYAGNNGQALASFLTCGLMGAITVENSYRLGMKHPQTLFFGSLFTVFYIGNIWGSAVSVQLVKIEKDLENRHNILVAVKLPLERFFR